MRAAPLLLFVVLLAGCSSGRSGDAAFATKAQGAAAAPMREAAVGGYEGGMAALKAEAPGAGEGGAKAAAYAPPPEAPRMIVRNGEISLRVKDVRIAEAQVREVARAARGVVEASQGNDLEGPNPSQTITLRVPEPLFDNTLDNLETLGARLAKTVASEDVTAQAVDMEARIKSLRVQEDAYRAILGAARKITDVLEVQERLTGVRTEIERIVAARRGLGDQAARSKIVVSLTQVQPLAIPLAKRAEPNWIVQTWSDATGTLASVAKGLASLALWLLVMSPVWIPLGLLAFFVYRRARASQTA